MPQPKSIVAHLAAMSDKQFERVS
ncbi:uncharacterized protein METZ01_LOCUS442572 [marine metagenome]|uniref:Uncharacterized protein n=1 Tax=marine metagenome TaxID=408172 RepID=A0A382Z4Q7_9ZZZZ